VIRVLVLYLSVGWITITSTALTQSVIFGIACLARLYTINRHMAVVLVEPDNSLLPAGKARAAH